MARGPPCPLDASRILRAARLAYRYVMPGRLGPDTRARRIAIAVAVYVLTTAVYFAFAARSTLTTHTPWNHFALQAEAWLAGHLDLGGEPPAYTGYNDFACYQGRWFVVFPPFPAMLLVPLVALGGSAQKVQDGQFFIWLAGVGPAVLFLALEKLRRTGRSNLSVRGSFLVSILFAFGTVYFFTAEQGTVWYAAHVVGVALAALYLLFALDAERPWLAGIMIGLGLLTRSPLLFAAPLFMLEAYRVSTRPPGKAPAEPAPEGASPPVGVAGSPAWLARARRLWDGVDRPRLLGLALAFSLPVVAAIALTLAHNQARFDDPLEFGYQHLTVAWQGRMKQWGLFHYHYLGRNLGVLLTSLPWLTRPPAPVPFQISGHGLALWVTSPFFLWLLWPRRTGRLHFALLVTVAAVALPTLLYQNTGWVQFGYRFSNDYAVFMVAWLAIGGHRFRWPFWGSAVWAVAINAFGAMSFNRPDYGAYYHVEGSQRVLYQPD